MRSLLPWSACLLLLGCNALIGLEEGAPEGSGGGDLFADATSSTGAFGSGPANASSGSASAAATSSSGAGASGAASSGASSASGATTSTGGSSGGACGNGDACAPLASGWNGPFGVSDSNACPPGWSTYLSGGHDVDSSAVTCSDCSCDDAPVSCHATANIYLGPACTSLLTSFEISNFACQSNPVPAGGSFDLDPGTPDVGTCSAKGGERSGAPALTDMSALCSPPSTSDACPGGEVCFAEPTPDLRPTLCVEQDGDVGCPASYPNKDVVYTSVDDELSCGKCTCGGASGASCDIEVVFSNDALCQGASEDVHGGMCEPIAAGGYAQCNQPIGKATCTAKGGGVQGMAAPQGPKTICCM